MLSKKILFTLCLSLLLFVSFYKVSKAYNPPPTNNGYHTDGMYEVDGDNETKDENFILPGPTGQTYAYNVRSVVVISTDPGWINVEICIARPDGLIVACGTPVNNVGFGRVQDWATEGARSMDLNWVGGGYLVIHIRVDSSSHYTTQTTVTAYGRYVNAGTLSASPSTVNRGQTTNLYFNPINNISNISIYDLTHSIFDWEVWPDETRARTDPINEDTTFAIMVKGPCRDGSAGECISDSNQVTVRVAKATVACVVHRSTITGPPISGATCNIAGQSGTTDGNGYRAFNNISQGNQTLTVTANGYNSYSGNRDITGNYDWHVALTQSCSGNWGQSCSVTSNANACGQRSTNTGTYECNGSCSVGTPNPPPTPAPVACTGQTSGANSCGDTNPGGAGTIRCYGTSRQSACSGVNGSTPAERANYGSACSAVASAPNICGMVDYGTNGTYVCNGGANSGGGTSCNAVNGVTPPNSSCPAAVATISANPNPVGYGGSSTISWLCTNSSSGSVPGIGSGLNSSGSTGALYSNQTYTVTCAGFSGSNVSNSVTVTVSAPSVTLTCNPTSVAYGGSSTISWTSSNANSCTKSGDWSGSATPNTSGSQSTGVLNQVKTYSYTLSCSGNGSDTKNCTVGVIAPPPTTSSVTITEPNYCASGPAVTMSWGYSDLAGSPQSAYQVQFDDQGSFNSINVDSGKVMSGSNAWYSGQGVFAFNTVYHARVRTWSGYDAVSSWREATICSGPGCTGGGANSWKTPPYAYPQTDFNWTANGILNNPSPPLNKSVQFTDITVFGGNPNGRQWSWTLGDGGTSTTQNPSHIYSAEGSYYVTLTATDNANQVCVRTKGPLIIQKPIPKWREVAPK